MTRPISERQLLITYRRWNMFTVWNSIRPTSNSCGFDAKLQSINQSCIFRVVQVIKSLQDPLEVGNSLPGMITYPKQMEVMEFGQQQRHMAHTTTNEAHSPATSPPRTSRRFTGSPIGVVPHAPSNQTAFTVGRIATNSNILAQRDFPVGFTISTLFSYGGHTSSLWAVAI